MRGLCPTRPSGRIPALRTQTAGPRIGAHPPILYPVETPHCGQHQRHQQWVLTHQYRVRASLRIAGQPGRHHPAGGELSNGGHIGRGGAARAATMTPTVGKSSTGRRVRPRTPMDSTSTTRPTTHPQNRCSGQHSALRTVAEPPIIGAHPRTADRGQAPHCGQHRENQQ